MSTFFVTGATGLLGNHVVRLLLQEGHRVRALVRDREKGARQFANQPAGLQWVEGDMADVAGFAAHLAGVDGVIHTAAYFRDSYKGGTHAQKMLDINVQGTLALLEAGVAAGVRRWVHISSVATLKPPPDRAGHEGDRRQAEGEPDDYFRSKILSDEAIDAFLQAHPEVDLGFLLPGFMVGPGDLGPTSSGQMVLDFAKRKLPGVIQTSVSMVDARDVAQAAVTLLHALPRHRGERFVVAGRSKTMKELYVLMEQAIGQPAPTRMIPDLALWAYALASEGFARLSGRPVLLSWAGVRNLLNERDRSNFSSSKAEKALGVSFRPLVETLRDTHQDYVQRGAL